MKYLIVNADDYGLNENINRGIILAHSRGIVTSTTVLANGDAFHSGVHALKENPRLGVGVHLTLVNGNPLSSPKEIPSLIDCNGMFFRSYQEFLTRFLVGKIKVAEIQKEWQKQISHVQNQGLVITHLDSHQHLHVFPGIRKVTLELARQFQIQKIRVPYEKMMFFGGTIPSCSRLVARNLLSSVSSLSKVYFLKQNLRSTQHFYGMLWGGHLSQNRLETLVQHLPEGISEIMTHPGIDNQELERRLVWGYQWEEELAALTALNVKTIINQQQIQLINYQDL